jgi:hypothetical protein
MTVLVSATIRILRAAFGACRANFSLNFVGGQQRLVQGVKLVKCPPQLLGRLGALASFLEVDKILHLGPPLWRQGLDLVEQRFRVGTHA